MDDYDLYATEPHNDIELARLARALLDEADVVVGHNSTAFDVKKCQARMVYHQLDPPSSFKEVDTLKQARRHFAFNGNSLDDLTRHLGIGAKGHPGLKTWFRCIEGEPGAWKRMKAYCRQDVKLLEKLYLRLLPYMNHHPNLALIAGKPDACPKCLADAAHLIVRKYRYNGVTSRVQYQCTACRSYCAGREMLKSDVQFVP